MNALAKGATVLWLNTVLYACHPIEKFADQNLFVVGQIPENVEKYDDKIVTNHLLKQNGLPVPDSVIITIDNRDQVIVPFSFPVVAKPIRGRGSQGVSVLHNWHTLTETLNLLFEEGQYGTALYLEEFLPGQEVTITVMPPGKYFDKGQEIEYPGYWSLPAVKRFNHESGIAPYNGTVAVTNNSIVLTEEELQTKKIQTLYLQCEKAAALVEAKAPFRIDCWADKNGQYFLFDLNMKPNMTGVARAHRQDQDSLSALAARKIGWEFTDLLINMLNQRWSL
ncbi:ATP-grasp domain-containing protein [Cytophagaceae bacterium DM2B3-1]|uniref:ATP-grasp domain-containing protein n=1 Tax=Xanthocytophaga flava TaxID=3048013 RepID=A0ABT7CU16_9BACT|nr:ATP-grasp domain-containing protein [Xanthocytophaga flavus]MDJ1497254.1 ATP-grasp domain-containing protein [Xanthocytophaga flavus]